jgi:hypothetical protein
MELKPSEFILRPDHVRNNEHLAEEDGVLPQDADDAAEGTCRAQRLHTEFVKEKTTSRRLLPARCVTLEWIISILLKHSDSFLQNVLQSRSRSIRHFKMAAASRNRQSSSDAFFQIAKKVSNSTNGYFLRVSRNRMRFHHSQVQATKGWTTTNGEMTVVIRLSCAVHAMTCPDASR